MLGRAVGVEEVAAHVHDGGAVPAPCARAPLSVTSATGVASRFSSCAQRDERVHVLRPPAPRPCAPGSRRWPAPCRPGPRTSWARVFRSMYRPSASSPMATDTPPAPKSLQRLIMRHASPRRNRRWILRSTGALPFCTSAPHVSSDSSLCALEEPVAPPHAVAARAPAQQARSRRPGPGVSRRTWSAGVAPTTAPISMRLAA